MQAFNEGKAAGPAHVRYLTVPPEELKTPGNGGQRVVIHGRNASYPCQSSVVRLQCFCLTIGNGQQTTVKEENLMSLKRAFSMAACFLAVLCLGGVLTAATQAAGRPIKVLMSTGDWKSQPWYQDVWMKDKDGKTHLYRGRFIARKVEEAVGPGRFTFTDIPNYLAKQYIDADYLSQFDVVLLGDIMMHLSPKVQTALRDFVKNGGD